jgi:hypothetical protein
MQPRRLVRILCLHGYTQNGSVFKNKIGSTRKLLRSHCEFIFVDAPFLSGDIEEQRSWWNTKEKPSASVNYEGFPSALREIAKIVIENAPIEGLFGFSQGSTAAALFLGLFI